MDKKKIVKEIIKKKPTILEDLIGIKNKKLIDELTLEKKKDPEVKATHNDAYGYPGKRGQMDILYLPNDKGFKYLLVAVDNYTKKTDAIPLRYRTAEAVRKAIDKIYFENKILEPPIILQVDAGSEFKKGLDEYLKKKNIHLRRASVARHSQQANVEARNKSIGSLIMKSQLVKELENNKVSKEWLKLLPKILKKINDNAKPKKMKQTGDVPCMKNGDCNLYNVGKMVRYKTDYPLNYKGERLSGNNFREGDIRYSIKPHKIENILLIPDRPVRYILEGIKDKTFSKNQLKPVENEIVKKIVAKKTIKPKKKWVDEPIEILTGKRNRKKVYRGVFIGNGKFKTPFCRIGRKDNLLRTLLSLIPKHDIYIEPFVGSGIVFFQKPPAKKSIINDLDDNIYNLFKMLKKGKFDYSKFILNFKERRNPDNIKKVNEVYQELLTSKDKSKEFQRRLMLNCLTFAGIQKGKLVISGGIINKLKKETLDEFIKKLKNTKVLNQDYKQIIKKYDDYDAFIFLDPPYQDSKSLYENYYIDYKEMNDLLKNLKGKFLLTINDSQEIRKSFSSFKIKKINVKGKTGVKNSIGGKIRKELIITNYL